MISEVPNDVLTPYGHLVGPVHPGSKNPHAVHLVFSADRISSPEQGFFYWHLRRETHTTDLWVQEVRDAEVADAAGGRPGHLPGGFALP